MYWLCNLRVEGSAIIVVSTLQIGNDNPELECIKCNAIKADMKLPSASSSSLLPHALVVDCHASQVSVRSRCPWSQPIRGMFHDDARGIDLHVACSWSQPTGTRWHAT